MWCNGVTVATDKMASVFACHPVVKTLGNQRRKRTWEFYSCFAEAAQKQIRCNLLWSPVSVEVEHMNQVAVQAGTGKAAKVSSEQSTLQQGGLLATTTYKHAADAKYSQCEVYRDLWDCRNTLGYKSTLLLL